MDSYVVSLVLLVSINLTLLLGHVAGSKVLQIRGIPVSKNPLYSPERDFQCLDGSLLIPFSYVNDDYCDCNDGSDEPGTPACTNGVFYCENLGHKPRYIPSTWVNDGVCDCCDASDEYASGKDCPNICNELGREARLEQRKAEELIREGSKIRAEMVNKGKRLKTEYQSKVVKLRAEFEEANLAKKEKEILRMRAEEREAAALEKYKPVEPEQPPAAEQDQHQEIEAEDYFKLLDSDNSGTVTIMELQTRVTFDKDRDGAVTEEEALYFLSDQREVTLQQFVESAWANIKPFLMLEQGLFKPDEKEAERGPEGETETEAEADVEGEADEAEIPEDGTEHEEEHEKEEEDDGEEDEPATEDQEKTAEAQIQYDEETQALIDEASAARDRFQEAERAASDLQNEIRNLEEKLDRDYGAEEEFAALDGECFEYTDLEYVYTLCMFGKATQRSKAGGSDIILGHWHEWAGPAGNKYSKMKYDRGITCWNGPERSVAVTLVCGKENKLTSVTEPSRCEYAMEFATPALCKLSMESSDTHDEL